MEDGAKGVDERTNISCVTIDDCPIIGGMSACSNSGFCIGRGVKYEVRGDSFGIETGSGEVVNVIGTGFEVGDRVKLAVRDSAVVESGGL